MGWPKIGVLKDKLLEELAPLGLNLARLKCLVLLLASLLRHRTVNLTILATQNFSSALNESCYRRFQRFFLSSTLCGSAVGRLILRKLPEPACGWTLSMDRTNWKFGKKHINILTVGVVIGKIAIPIAWKVLPQSTKRGNSNTKHRVELFTKVLEMMPAAGIRLLAMDREFAGREWLQWLDGKDIAYIARIKGNTLVDGRRADSYRATRRAKATSVRATVFDLEVHFAGKTIQSKGRRDERLYVVSNRFGGKEALELYKLRWGIELLFSHLKKRGFNLEATHMTEAGKIEKLFALVSLAFLYSYAWGCHLRATRKVTKAVMRKSIFRHGLEDILRLLGNQHLEQSERDTFTDWLKSPFPAGFFVV